MSQSTNIRLIKKNKMNNTEEIHYKIKQEV